MAPETLKLFRINVLSQLRAAGRLGLSATELVVNLKTVGFPKVTDDEVTEEIQYLSDKKQIEKLPAEISPEVESYRITDVGRDFLAVNHL
jgi:hypothetical protein